MPKHLRRTLKWTRPSEDTTDANYGACFGSGDVIVAPFLFLNATVSMFTASPTSYSTLFSRSLIALGRRASGRGLAHKRRGIVNKIRAFWKDTVQRDPSPLQGKDTVKIMSIRNSISFPRSWLKCYPGLGLLGKVNISYIGYTVHSIWMNTYLNNNTMVPLHTHVVTIFSKEQWRLSPINISMSFLYFYNDIVLVTD